MHGLPPDNGNEGALVKLTAKAIGGMTAGVSVFSWNEADLDGQPAFMAEATISDGRIEISSIKNWNRYGSEAGCDYKFIRREIMVIAAAQGFSNLVAEEKEIAAKMFAVSKTDRDTLFALEAQIEHGRVFHHESVRCRRSRARSLEVELYNRIGGETTGQMIDLGAIPLNLYIQFGREGTESGDSSGIYDVIQATEGTAYETTGLAALSAITPYGMTLAQLVDRCMDILRNGA